MPGMGFGFGFGFHRRASGSGASASAQLLTLATDDGWTSLDDPTNPNRTLRNDGADDYLAEIPEALGNLTNLVQATAAEQPQLSVGAFGQLDGAVGDGSAAHMNTATFASISQPYTVVALVKANSISGGPLRRPVRFSESDGLSSGFFIADRAGTWEFSGGTSLVDGAVDLSSHVHTCIVDGASSIYRIDGSQVASGDAGTLSFVTRHILTTLDGSGNPNNLFDGVVGVVAVLESKNLTKIGAMEDKIMFLAGLS